MKNVNVSDFALTELSHKELRETTGGGLFAIFAAIVIAAGFCWGVANFVKDVIIEGEQFDMSKW